AAARGEKFDHCILGEPSNVEELGDTIKIGRRGSLNGHLIVHGRQGHVAYPERAENPIRGLVKLVAALQAEPLDKGSKLFPPSHLEFTSVDVGNKTVNLIPGEARARFNIRFNDRHTLASLKKLIERRAAKAAGKIKFAFAWEPSNARVFVTEPGPFTEFVAQAIRKITGRKPKLSTSGGTSDARFIIAHCPVVEFGLVGQTMHQVDERVPVADLRVLTKVYRTIIDNYFAQE
ncbi:MAG: succinyl-diaminopimelate desuccinylase, partial [Pseudolabrys sp.]